MSTENVEETINSLKNVNINQNFSEKEIELINDLREKIVQHDGLKKINGVVKFSDELLIKFIRARNNDSKRTFDLFLNYIRYIRQRKDIFKEEEKLEMIIKTGLFKALPKCAPSGCKVHMICAAGWDPSKANVTELVRSSLPHMELSVSEDTAQENGIAVIIDMNGVGWRHVLHLSPTVAKLASDLTEHVMPVKFTRFHVLHQNWLVDWTYAIFKPIISEETKRIIVFHGSNFDKLYSEIPKELLPKSIGGDLDYSDDDYYQELSKSTSKHYQLWKKIQSVDGVTL